ncbi:8-amino-7-oxononanoate synthase [candidate division LCP-89 bacterium B3_LCP]|uniref:8-amino-7-oxononanoate synthase n=1 Tax=candidate division LCP-89 bacterium B3_LCP TaxID=2012998 RepID=A0A532V3F2_UNCL8|nr:MAG: 8-amino-7-oxononanoate synthase [candidate division LCP-89 bacterium B3_LCP]
MRIRDRARAFTAAREVMALGYYPYFRPIESDQDTVVHLDGKEVLMLGSNNYLGLTNHPEVKEAAMQAIRDFGTGCAGSRFLNGTLVIHIELEEKLAEFLNKEAVLLFSTGFQVNQGVISTLIGKDSVVFSDKLDHASIIDGCRLAFGRSLKYNHNDMTDLERVLKSVNEAKSRLIVVDGVFSMEGDIAKLPEIVRLAEEYDTEVMVDDAHSLGVLGPNGDGTAAHFGLNDRVALIMGTFSKSLASVGGFIASDEDTIHYLKHHSRALIFSASPPPASVASVLKALEIVQREPERRQKLWDNTHRLVAGLKESGFDLGPSETPIIPVIVGDNLKVFIFCKRLQEEGIFVNPVVSPAVQPGNQLIRISLMSTHSFDQVDFALEKLTLVGKELELIP